MKARKLPSGNWRVNAYVGKDYNGKQIRKSFTATTKKEAEFLAAQYLATHKENETGADMLLSEAYSRYISSKENVLSPSTIRGYKQMARTHFLNLMPCKLSVLTREKIQKAANEESLTCSPKTIRNNYGLLVAVLKAYCPSLRLDIRLPQKEKVDIPIPTEAQIKTLLNSVENTEIEKAILLGAIGGLRRSEISALTAADVSADGVRVNKAYVSDEHGNWILKTTKTTDSTRFVTLPKEVIDKLKPQNGADKIVNLNPNMITKAFRTACLSSFGYTYRFHSLRHFSASFLHSLNVPTAYIMKRGGWSNPATLQKIYTHTMEQREKEFNDFINNQFSDVFSKK